MKKRMKFIVLISLLSFLLCLWSFDGSILNRTALANEANDGGTIGGIIVEGLKKDEILSKITTVIDEWKEHEVVVQGSGETLSIPTEYFAFDVQASVEEYLDSVSKSWYAFWKKTQTVHVPLVVTIDPQVKVIIAETSIFNTDETYDRIAEQVSYLTSSPIDGVEIDLSLYESERIAFSYIELLEDTTGLLDVVNLLNDRLIVNGETFSLLNETESIDGVVSDETMNFVASVLYSVILQTDYEFVERHSQNVTPSYSTPGIEAKVQRSLKEDLQFINSSLAPTKLKLSIEGNRLLVEVYSLPTETKAAYHVVDDTVIKPRIIYRYSSELAIGEERLLQEGIPGVRVSVYRVVSDKLGPFEKETLIARDYYPPVNRIVLKSSKQPESTITDTDTSIDLDGNGLPDIVENGDGNRDDKGEVSLESTPEIGIDLDDLPDGSYYDKGGNLVIPTNK